MPNTGGSECRAYAQTLQNSLSESRDQLHADAGIADWQHMAIFLSRMATGIALALLVVELALGVLPGDRHGRWPLSERPIGYSQWKKSTQARKIMMAY